MPSDVTENLVKISHMIAVSCTLVTVTTSYMISVSCTLVTVTTSYMIVMLAVSWSLLKLVNISLLKLSKFVEHL